MGLMILTYYNPVRSGRSEYEKRQRQDVGASSAWLDTVFPVHPSDADEAVDEVAGTDFSPAHAAAVMLSEATGCHDFDCLTTSIECENCKFGGAKSEEAEEVDLAAVLKDMQAVDSLREKSKDLKSKKGPSFFHCGTHEAWYEQLALASRGRGRRAQTELQISGRMGC